MSRITAPSLGDVQAAALNMGYLLRVDRDGVAVRKIGELAEHRFRDVFAALDWIRSQSHV